MPPDRSLRDSLTRVAATVAPDVEWHLAATRRRFRRRQRISRSALAAVVLVAIGVAVPFALRGRHDTSGRVVASPLTNAQARVLLQDTWVTETVTMAQVKRTLTEAGLAAHADVVTVEQGYPTGWTLRITRGRYEVRSSRGVQTDNGAWTVDGDVLTLKPTPCTCTLTFRWTIRHGRLRLALVDDASPDIGGVPDEAFARALFTAAAFARAPAQTPGPTAG